MLVLLKTGSWFSPKLRATLRQQREICLESVLAKRNMQQPLVWFHAASAGEFLQGLPVMRHLLEAKVLCVLSFSSPSTAAWAKRSQAKHALWRASFPLPLDNRHRIQGLLQRLKPAALVFIKYDLWPNLVWEARLTGIPIHLLGGTLHRHSGRWKWGLRGWFRCLLESTSHLAAASETDAGYFRALCPQHKYIRVLGDSRFDSVLERLKEAPPAVPAGIAQAKQVLVVGSSWPQDERLLLSGIKQALRQFADFAVVLAPHEPASQPLAYLQQALGEFGCVRLSQAGRSAADAATNDSRVLLVDEVGRLASCYKLGSMAYVGGGHTTGVHSVLEPAAAGLAVSFGPFYQNSVEAGEMEAQGLAVCTATAQAFSRQLLKWLQSPATTRQIGQQAQVFVKQRAGAARACSQQILDSLPPAPQQP